VYIVDFSYPLEDLLKMAASVKSVTVLDHHKSAVRRLQEQADSPLPDNLTLILDMDRSGAGLAWEYFFPDLSVPDIVKYVEDRDLWRFKYGESTKMYVRALMARPFELISYESVFRSPSIKTIDEGSLLLSSDRRHIDWHLNNATRLIRFAGRDVPLVNAPKYLVSEITNELVKDYPIAMAYHDASDGRLFRVTTAKDSGIDASSLAEQYGGGGHENAAGFFVTYDQDLF
jgi:oligoribonuclease NrnB/cAMP/cGMP phosphodiesterase (DHH superfamily)